MPISDHPGRVVGAGFLRALILTDEQAIEQYRTLYDADDLLDALSEQAYGLVLRVALLTGVSPSVMADHLVGAASLRDAVEA